MPRKLDEAASGYNQYARAPYSVQQSTLPNHQYNRQSLKRRENPVVPQNTDYPTLSRRDHTTMNANTLPMDTDDAILSNNHKYPGGARSKIPDWTPQVDRSSGTKQYGAAHIQSNNNAYSNPSVSAQSAHVTTNMRNPMSQRTPSTNINNELHIRSILNKWTK